MKWDDDDKPPSVSLFVNRYRGGNEDTLSYSWVAYTVPFDGRIYFHFEPTQRAPRPEVLLEVLQESVADRMGPLFAQSEALAWGTLTGDELLVYQSRLDLAVLNECRRQLSLDANRNTRFTDRLKRARIPGVQQPEQLGFEF